MKITSASDWFDKRPNVITRSAWVKFIEDIQIEAFCAAKQHAPESPADAPTVDRQLTALATALAMRLL
jgi:hypothetical protein